MYENSAGTTNLRIEMHLPRRYPGEGFIFRGKNLSFLSRILSGGVTLPYCYMNATVKTFCRIAFYEGISYVLLLAVAMPLKYAFDMPLAVKIVGWAHGVLFMAYMLFLGLCWVRLRWSFSRVAGYFLASLLPLVPFWVDKRLRQEYGKV